MDREKLQQTALALPEQARIIKITDQETLDKASEFLSWVKALKKESSGVFDPIVSQAHRAHKEALAAKKKIEAPMIEAERIIKAEMGRFHLKQKQIREAEERRLRAIAEKAAEEERLAMAIELEEAGETEAAEEVFRAPIAPVVIQAPPTPKSKNESYVERWTGKCTDMRALVRWVAQNPQMIHLLKPNDSEINAMARRQKDALNIPGITVEKLLDVRKR